MKNDIESTKLFAEDSYPFEFSICTLVTKKTEYQEMLNSFYEKGFKPGLCEFLYIDNTETCTLDAYKGLNKFLQEAKGKYIILCHQDIIIHDHDIQHLLLNIDDIEKADKDWAILGNAGGVNLKWIATNITQVCGNRITEDRLPLRTKTVDENFIVVKKSANLALSRNLSGFHLYGTDLCLIADILGFNAYVIDFNLTHKSNGNADKSFYDLKKALLKKYKYALRGRFMSTTITRFYVSGNWFTLYLYNMQPIKFIVRQYLKIFKRKKRYVLKTEHNNA
ncbi:hypothetical protein [Pedobacter hiemivivus]|uniref:Acyl esterase n=1 Tax=Pedobacter hiemivivus TaxID=2530454 RepID=A0A4R0ND03_9SPHI|nr:hypothetical protein [Pedobacter hiemivivus]TCC97567.1 hypothetical protein EZ444_06520 [Pedobacter hiemivivus]